MPLRLSELEDKDYVIVDRAPEEEGEPGLFPGLARGLGMAAGELVLGVGELGRGIQRTIGGGAGLGGESIFDRGGATNTKTREAFEPTTGAEATGKFVGTAAQYLAPTSGIVRGQQLLRGAASKIPQAAPGIIRGTANLAARIAPEAVGTGTVTALREGGDLDLASRDAGIAAGISTVTGGLGGLARASYWPELQDTVSKALGIQGKVSGGMVQREIANKVSGLGVLKKYANDLTVKNADGVETVFNPKEATYDTTIQAWNGAKEKVFAEYSALAKKAGESATVDLSPIRGLLQQTLDEPRLAPYKRAAEALIKDIDENFPEPTTADIERVQTFLKDLNSNTAQGFFKGTADNATAEINAGTAKAIRENLDNLITEATGQNYGALRSEYAALKAIEGDLVRRFQQSARRIGGGLQDYVDMFSSGEIISGIVSANPVLVTSGFAKGALGQLRRVFANPERFLRRSFELIDDKEANDLTLRLFGGSGR